MRYIIKNHARGSTISRIIKLSVFTLVFFAALALGGESAFSYSWNSPSTPFPGGNPYPPLDIGAGTQDKEGAIGFSGNPRAVLQLAPGQWIGAGADPGSAKIIPLKGTDTHFITTLNGALGIGTLGTYAITASRNLSGNNRLVLDVYGAVNAKGFFTNGVVTGSLDPRWVDITNPFPGIVYTQGGNVGIGPVSSPSSKLSVAGHTDIKGSLSVGTNMSVQGNYLGVSSTVSAHAGNLSIILKPQGAGLDHSYGAWSSSSSPTPGNDTCPRNNPVTDPDGTLFEFYCTGEDFVSQCTDWARIQNSPDYYSREVRCVIQTKNYTLKSEGGDFKFIDGNEKARFILSSDGSTRLEGANNPAWLALNSGIRTGALATSSYAGILFRYGNYNFWSMYKGLMPEDNNNFRISRYNSSSYQDSPFSIMKDSGKAVFEKGIYIKGPIVPGPSMRGPSMVLRLTDSEGNNEWTYPEPPVSTTFTRFKSGTFSTLSTSTCNTSPPYFQQSIAVDFKPFADTSASVLLSLPSSWYNADPGGNYALAALSGVTTVVRNGLNNYTVNVKVYTYGNYCYRNIFYTILGYTEL